MNMNAPKITMRAFLKPLEQADTLSLMKWINEHILIIEGVPNHISVYEEDKCVVIDGGVELVTAVSKLLTKPRQ